MSNTIYTPQFKHHVLTTYVESRPRPSLRSLARRFNIKGGDKCIRSWLSDWDGTVQSLERKAGQGRHRILNTTQVKQLITTPIITSNRLPEPIHYQSLYHTIPRKMHRQISPRTIRRYGHDEGRINIKRTIKRKDVECTLQHNISHLMLAFLSRTTINNCSTFFFVCVLVSPKLCDDIAKFRRWCQNISNRKLLFLDESHIRISEAPTTTLVAPGESAHVVVDDNTKYAARYDIIICINGERALPCIIYSPSDRKRLKVDGIRAFMVEQFIDDILAQAVGALDEYPLYLIIDNSPAHNRERMLEAFRDRGCQDLKDIIFMPPNASKRLSPLDNGFIHEWKERVRQQGRMKPNTIIQHMHNQLHQIPAKHIHNFYRHCALTDGTDAYYDCPAPHRHRHQPSS